MMIYELDAEYCSSMFQSFVSCCLSLVHLFQEAVVCVCVCEPLGVTGIPLNLFLVCFF